MATCTDCEGVCSTWVDADDIDCPGNIEDYSVELEEAVQVASDWLYMATGRRFPGCCQATVRPCPKMRVTDRDPTGWYRELPQEAGWYAPSGWNSSWGYLTGTSGWCGCGQRERCGSCTSPSEISLGLEPVREIVSVVVDGVTLPASAYQVMDYSTLMRTDGDGWPCCNDLSIESGEGAWSVTFTYGRNPPQMGVSAVKKLACEIAKDLTDQGECELPANVRSVVRLGVTQEFETIANAEGPSGWMTGLWLVDRFISAYNPSGLIREAEIHSPDIGRSARVITG